MCAKKTQNHLVVEYQPFVMSQGAASPLAGQCQHFRPPVLFNMNMCLIVKDHPVDFTHSTKYAEGAVLETNPL